MTGIVARLRALWSDLPANLRGALWILLAAFLLTGMGALVKHMGKDIPSMQMVFFRNLVSVAVVAPLMLRNGFSAFYTKKPGWHVFRTLMGTTGMFCVFYAFAHLPLAETVAIVFSRPLFAVWLAILFLGEVVGWRRISAAVVGFLGVLVMVRPGTAAFDPASLFAVTAAITAGSIAVIIKKMSATESTATIILWFSVGSAVITAVPAFFVWVPPTPMQWVVLFAIGIIGVSGMAALTKGFSTGETSFVTPFDYSRLIYATAIGFLIFGETPDVFSILGALIIVSSGYYVARRELAATRKRLREKRAAEAAQGPARPSGPD
ncbi:MAG TPA: DMT family transporter [Alphaproteobacteria bacterium]|nr:DMT family transporter [Alphaproteobacteria bacterium]